MLWGRSLYNEAEVEFEAVNIYIEASDIVVVNVRCTHVSGNTQMSLTCNGCMYSETNSQYVFSCLFIYTDKIVQTKSNLES